MHVTLYTNIENCIVKRILKVELQITERMFAFLTKPVLQRGLHVCAYIHI